MFAIDQATGRPRLLFHVGETDLALAFASLEGFEIVTGKATEILPIDWRSANHHRLGTAPEQVSPGVFCFKLRRARS